MNTTALLLVAITVAADPKPGQEGTPEYEKAAKLVQQLGTPRFAVREAAAKELLEMGPLAIPALQAGTKATDEEVHTRCTALLPQVKAAEWKRRADAYLADKEGKEKHDLPFLAEWNKVVGKPDAGSRKLFAEMIKANSEFLEEVARDPKAGPEVVRARCRVVLSEVQGLRQLRADPVLLAALFLAHQQVPAAPARWGELDHPAFLVANPALVDELKDPKANGLNVRAVAVSALARVGDDPARKALTELLADKTPLTSSVPHTIGDQALAGLVNLSKKKPADYQQTKSIHILFKWVACEKPIGLDFYTFVDDDARKAGLRKWKDEAAKDKKDR